jgi:hypothetical protein
MITAQHAIEVAHRRQRRALREAAGFAAVLGEPVGFVRRAVAGGTVFEAVALDSARTCAVVDERGTLRLAPPARPREPWAYSGPLDRDALAADPAPPVVAPRFGSRAAAERALVAAARPGPREG